jgi:hypothetical protein
MVVGFVVASPLGRIVWMLYAGTRYSAGPFLNRYKSYHTALKGRRDLGFVLNVKRLSCIILHAVRGPILKVMTVHPSIVLLA